MARRKGTLYEDDGDGFAYREGAYAFTHYSAKQEGDAVVVRQERQEGNTKLPARDVTVEVVTADRVLKAHGQIADGIRVNLAPQSAK